MSVKLLSKRDQEIVEDALRNPEGSSALFGLSVGDLELGDRIYDGEWGSDNGGAIYVDFSIAERLPLDYYDAPSSFAVWVNGVAVPQMAGLVSFPAIRDPDAASTEFVAASARAQPIVLAEVTQYPGVPPDEVVRDAFSRLSYSRNHTRIDALKEPLLNWQAPTSHFWPNETAQDVLKRVEDQTPFKIRDNVWGGGVASVALEPSQVKEYRVYDANDFIKWRPPPIVERRYRDVVVFKRNDDGTDAFLPQRAEIDYKKRRYLPPKGAELWIELDSDADATRARNLANTYATQFGRGVYKDSSIILPIFDPLIEIMDVFWVFETAWEDSSGLYDRQWMCWVEAYKHDFAELTTEVSHSAALMQEEKIQAPTLAMAGLSGGVLETALGLCEIVGSEYWLDGSLEWFVVEGDEIVFAQDAPEVSVEGDEVVINCLPLLCREDFSGNLVLSSSLEWITQSGEDILIDLDKAGFSAYEDGEDIVIECPDRPGPLWGELIPYELVIDESVSWAWIEGDEWVIDTAASGGHASVDGDEVVISQ